jgi:hypothetical protein
MRLPRAYLGDRSGFRRKERFPVAESTELRLLGL